MNSNAMVIVLMGVCGSAKSCACVCVESRTIDEMLGKALDFTFLDADYFHPVSNKASKFLQPKQKFYFPIAMDFRSLSRTELQATPFVRGIRFRPISLMLPWPTLLPFFNP
ncbi:uncharacterized protein LOC103504679 isoform X1 [Cucumis melo]|uniref:Uncharacterized protein LOC103504679 isoform X1 n=1 Tax=Cucumis melo TaxID=3656 RepID=A0A1S4E5F1_CUCME|nr:uncharacterized protein LOC103504679 isoform X1 [Cucumis melo]